MRTPVSPVGRGPTRRESLLAFSALLFVAVAFDMSIYVGGLFHLYTHDIASLAIGILGVLLALNSHSLLPRGRLLWVPLALLSFLLANTLILGAVQFTGVPLDMRRLFWFEHGNAIRIVGELLIWVWTLGHLEPTREDASVILDTGLWAATASVSLVGTYWAATNATHVGTTTFDLNVMVGLPMAMAFVMARGGRGDQVRLVIFAAASLFLYSRSAILAVSFTSVVLLLLVHRPRAVQASLSCVALGWLLVLGTSVASSELRARTPTSTAGNAESPVSSRPSPMLSPAMSPPPAFSITQPALDYTVSRGADAIGPAQPAIDRAASLVNNTAPYTIPSRLAIWSDAFRMFEISPIVGVGYHNYFMYSRVTEIKDASRFDVPGLFSSLIKQAHNDFLSWLVETGVLGLAFYLSFWGLVLLHGWRLLRAEPQALEYNAFTFAFMIGLLGISMLGEMLVPRTPNWLSSALLWWIMIGVLFINTGQLKEKQRRASR